MRDTGDWQFNISEAEADKQENTGYFHFKFVTIK